MLIRDVILQLSLDSTSAVAVFTLSPFPQDCKTTNTHRENRHWKHRENCRRANWPSGETIWYQWEGLTCYLTAFNSWLVFPRVSHHVRRGKIAHHKWILATLYSFTNLKTKTNSKSTDKIGDGTGTIPLVWYNKLRIQLSFLARPLFSQAMYLLVSVVLKKSFRRNKFFHSNTLNAWSWASLPRVSMYRIHVSPSISYLLFSPLHSCLS